MWGNEPQDHRTIGTFGSWIQIWRYDQRNRQCAEEIVTETWQTANVVEAMDNVPNKQTNKMKFALALRQSHSLLDNDKHDHVADLWGIMST